MKYVLKRVSEGVFYNEVVGVVKLANQRGSVSNTQPISVRPSRDSSMVLPVCARVHAMTGTCAGFCLHHVTECIGGVLGLCPSGSRLLGKTSHCLCTVTVADCAHCCCGCGSVYMMFCRSLNAYLLDLVPC